MSTKSSFVSIFNGTDLSSGIYLYQLRNNGNIIAQNKMLLMK